MYSKPRYKIIALFGESASGKDTLLKWAVSHFSDRLHPIVACTTRPPRQGEIDGVNYHFLSIEDFTQQVLQGEIIEATTFRDWFYGTQLSALDLDKINIGIFSPDALDCLIDNPNLSVQLIYVYTNDKTRLLRSLNREESPDCYEICRRYLADLKDFSEERLSEFTYSIVFMGDKATEQSRILVLTDAINHLDTNN